MTETQWIFLRGLGREAAHWGEFPKLWIEPETSIHTLDLQGCGRWHNEVSPSSLSLIAKHVQDQIALLPPAPHRYVIALSFGAMVALQLSRMEPSISGLVLVNTSLAQLSPFWQRMRMSSWFKVMRCFIANDLEVRERGIWRLTSCLQEQTARSHVSRWIEIAKEHPVSRHTIIAQLRAAQTSPLGPGKLHVPTLILASRGDRLVNFRCSVALAARLQAAIKVHATAGHDLPLDDPLWVKAEIHRWKTKLDM